jgi:hypothetical protein
MEKGINRKCIPGVFTKVEKIDQSTFPNSFYDPRALSMASNNSWKS